jgi:hypothetical protein
VNSFKLFFYHATKKKEAARRWCSLQRSIEKLTSIPAEGVVIDSNANIHG